MNLIGVRVVVLFGLSFLSCCFKCRAFCCLGLSCLCVGLCLCVDYAIIVACLAVVLFLAGCVMFLMCVVFVLCLVFCYEFD